MALLDIQAVVLMARFCSPDPNSLVSPTGGNVHAIWSPGHALDLILMALQNGYLLPYATLHAPAGITLKDLPADLNKLQAAFLSWAAVRPSDGRPGTCSSQTETVASKLAHAKQLPSGDQLQLRIVRAWVSWSTATHSQSDDRLLTAQSLTVLSLLVLASNSPDGDQATNQTHSV